MKPFAVLCGAQLLLLGMTVRALLLPHAWGWGYVHEPWLLIVHSILTGVWVYSSLYMVRGERAGDTAAVPADGVELCGIHHRWAHLAAFCPGALAAPQLL